MKELFSKAYWVNAFYELYEGCETSKQKVYRTLVLIYFFASMPIVMYAVEILKKGALIETDFDRFAFAWAFIWIICALMFRYEKNKRKIAKMAQEQKVEE
jgi:hypothetical protein